MQHITFLLKAPEGPKEALAAACGKLKSSLPPGAENFSLWGAGEFIFGYLEAKEGAREAVIKALDEALDRNFGEFAEIIAKPGARRLMFELPGDIQKDKSLIRHRVFMTRLKPDMAEEYKARHDALKAQLSNGESGAESSFTIWNAQNIICGYCEIIKDKEAEPDEISRKKTIEWETRQLEIMDWITDDVDWLTGEKNETVQRLI